jgi:hypothetical protein
MNKPIKSRMATIFLLLIGMSTFLIAQEGSVSGRITDTDTGDPLGGNQHHCFGHQSWCP